MQILDIVFYSLLGVYALLFFIFLFRYKKYLKLFTLISIAVFVLYAIIRIILQPIKIKNYDVLSDLGLYLSSGILIAIIILLAIFLDKKEGCNKTKSISFAGVCISLSFALSFIKIEFLGGSITLASALPLIIYSYIFGLRKGIMAGAIFGILQFIQKPTVYQPMQVILDYPVAFGGIGLSGIMKYSKKSPLIKFIVGATLGLFCRYVSHVISGYFVFYIFALDGWNPLSYSIVFNMNVLIDLAIVLFVGVFLFSNKSFIRVLENLKY